jgi:glycosyltransferase involved in cell wall biosynthesis
MQPVVSVIVPARDAAATLPRTLEALARQTLAEPYEVVVVDDGSRDGTAAIAKRAGARLVSSNGSGSAAAARNMGVEAAAGELLAFTDSDCFPAPGWLETGLRGLHDADVVSGRVEPELGDELGPFDRTLWVERETGLWETANLFVRRERFEDAGGFEHWLDDEGRPLGEDVWLGWRLRRAGARSVHCADALVHHAVFGRGAGDYLAERTRLRHFPAMAARVPELRSAFLYRRLFLTPRSAAFDAALLGAGTAAVRRSSWPLLLLLPYARLAARRALPYRRRAPLVAAVDVAADAVGFVSLLRGSIRHRTPVL